MAPEPHQVGTVGLALLVGWGNHAHREPWTEMYLVLGGLFAFVSVWRSHPQLGALLALAANLALIGLLAVRLVAFTPALRVGWPTPLDVLWKSEVRPLVHQPLG